MKKPHNMKSGSIKKFNSLLEIQEFAEMYEHKAEEFQLNYDANGQLEMMKI